LLRIHSINIFRKERSHIRPVFIFMCSNQESFHYCNSNLFSHTLISSFYSQSNN